MSDQFEISIFVEVRDIEILAAAAHRQNRWHPVWLSSDRWRRSRPSVRQLDKRHLKEKKRTDWLTRAEFDRLERACLEELHRMVVTTGVFTGLRHAEMRLPEKRHVNFANQTIQLPGEITKNGKPRTVPIMSEFSAQFDDYCSRTVGNYVFGHYCHSKKQYIPYSSFQGFFRLARRRAGLPNITLHGLRHTFASWWMQSGGDIYALKEILGHSSMQMVERYSHLDSGATRRAADQISTHSFGTVGQNSTHSSKGDAKT